MSDKLRKKFKCSNRNNFYLWLIKRINFIFQKLKNRVGAKLRSNEKSLLDC